MVKFQYKIFWTQAQSLAQSLKFYVIRLTANNVSLTTNWVFSNFAAYIYEHMCSTYNRGQKRRQNILLHRPVLIFFSSFNLHSLTFYTRISTLSYLTKSKPKTFVLDRMPGDSQEHFWQNWNAFQYNRKCI